MARAQTGRRGIAAIHLRRATMWPVLIISVAAMIAYNESGPLTLEMMPLVLYAGFCATPMMWFVKQARVGVFTAVVYWTTALVGTAGFLCFPVRFWVGMAEQRTGSAISRLVGIDNLTTGQATAWETVGWAGVCYALLGVVVLWVLLARLKWSDPKAVDSSAAGSGGFAASWATLDPPAGTSVTRPSTTIRPGDTGRQATTSQDE